MMRCSAFIATSLDGYIARPDGSLDWLPGSDGQAGADDYGFGDFYASVDTLIIGRKTWDFANHLPDWPYAGKRVVVRSRQHPAGPVPISPVAEGSSLPPEALASCLDREGMRHAYVDGGETIRDFLRAGLIDTITITRVPVLIGDGISLFGGLGKEIHLWHEHTRAYPDGLVQSRYVITTP